MRGLYGIVAWLIALAIAAPGMAATIERNEHSNSGWSIVTVSGEIEPGDGELFSRIAADRSAVLVRFDSRGGTTFDALQIGRKIRAMGYLTTVPRNGMCTSACALAWLGGVQRYIESNASLGFHATYIIQPDGSKLETGAGNAVVGAYLNQLGLADGAIRFATSAGPDEILWLNKRMSALYGIESYFDLAPRLPPLPPKPRLKPIEILMMDVNDQGRRSEKPSTDSDDEPPVQAKRDDDKFYRTRDREFLDSIVPIVPESGRVGGLTQIPKGPVSTQIPQSVQELKSPLISPP